MRRVILVAAAMAGVALPAQSPAPRVAPPSADYAPADKDERGLWLQADEYERDLANSNFVIRDQALNAYVRRVFCGMVGEAECRPVRIYLMRTPYFNASMAPNGMMQVWSGLFLRARDEAQLGAVLGHEYVHYRNRHSIQMLRDMKKKTGAMTWLGFVPFGFVAQMGVMSSIFSFSRDMEREADAGSITMLARQGYDPMAASRIWEQLRAEMDATAVARKRSSRKDKDGGMFATHPPTAERMATLRALAEAQKVAGPRTAKSEYRAALAPFWASFVDDQIKLNDFGGTDYLINALADGDWTAELYYMRGELLRARGQPTDFAPAAEAYRSATALPGAPVEAWRGLGLALLRSGDKPGGEAALKTYLAKAPQAGDRAMMAMLAGVKS